MIYGWRPDTPDIRDRYKVCAPRHDLPAKVDLRELYCPPVNNQGNLGSCTAQAIIGAYSMLVMKQGTTPKPMSPLFLYFNERDAEGTVESDGGAMIRTGIKCLAVSGVAHEECWPYDIAKFAVRPPKACYEEAMEHQALEYCRVTRSAPGLKAELADGYPVVFGFMVYESMHDPDTSTNARIKLPMPGEAALGGHAVVCVGYDDSDKTYLIRNSWGPEWADKGHFKMPYEYMHNPDLTDDFWSLRLVEIG